MTDKVTTKKPRANVKKETPKGYVEKTTSNGTIIRTYIKK